MQPKRQHTNNLHNDHPYDPPTFVNNVIFQALNRPNLQTPTAFTMHLRFGCKSVQVLKHTQKYVDGMHVQQGSWSTLESQLPCSTCIAGKMRKTRKNPTKSYTDVENFALSRHSATADKTLLRMKSFQWTGESFTNATLKMQTMSLLSSSTTIREWCFPMSLKAQGRLVQPS